jgi:hypothetical protein
MHTDTSNAQSSEALQTLWSVVLKSGRQEIQPARLLYNLEGY